MKMIKDIYVGTTKYDLEYEITNFVPTANDPKLRIAQKYYAIYKDTKGKTVFVGQIDIGANNQIEAKFSPVKIENPTGKDYNAVKYTWTHDTSLLKMTYRPTMSVVSSKFIISSGDFLCNFSQDYKSNQNTNNQNDEVPIIDLTEENMIADLLCRMFGLITGEIGKVIVAIILISTAVGYFMGKFELNKLANILLAIAIFFGGSSLLHYLMQKPDAKFGCTIRRKS